MYCNSCDTARTDHPNLRKPAEVQSELRSVPKSKEEVQRPLDDFLEEDCTRYRYKELEKHTRTMVSRTDALVTSFQEDFEDHVAGLEKCTVWRMPF